MWMFLIKAFIMPFGLDLYRLFDSFTKSSSKFKIVQGQGPTLRRLRRSISEDPLDYTGSVLRVTLVELNSRLSPRIVRTLPALGILRPKDTARTRLFSLRGRNFLAASHYGSARDRVSQWLADMGAEDRSFEEFLRLTRRFIQLAELSKKSNANC
ncbi:hypothetical protein V1477_016331 [Vespula maculifrons]|uniref:Uncharacterized protein n=2 Tax=Vespula TaxID=7451 RepID=A0A834K9N0_VESGE|nr:hypothetical protein HZH68_007561 [Vespula germanica]